MPAWVLFEKLERHGLGENLCQVEHRRASCSSLLVRRMLAFTPTKLVETVAELARDWEYEAITIGYPGLVGPHGPRSEPGNLGPGWVGFDFAAAFGKPVKMMNDAAMQALGSYEGGRMLFLGLGTGLGSTLIAGNVIVPLELGRLLFDEESDVARAQQIIQDEGRSMIDVTGVKVFSATKAKERELLGELITDWIRNHPEHEIVDKIVTQSSDSEFHCLTITLFYKHNAKS